MIKKENIVLYIIVFIEILILVNSKEVIDNIIQTSKLFFYHIFPSMLPTMFFSKLLISNNLKLIIPKFINRLFNKLFNFNDDLTTLFITSMICASPTNAILIDEYLNKGIINNRQAEILLGTTTFINPLFIIGTVGIYVLDNIKLGVLLLMLLYLSSFIKLFLNKKHFKDNDFKDTINKTNFINSIYNSINVVSSSILTVFIIIIIFNIISFLLVNIFNINSILTMVLKILLEITSGIISLKELDINVIPKVIICYLSLNFGGLCIQMQNISLIKNKKISYLKYLIFRII